MVIILFVIKGNLLGKLFPLSRIFTKAQSWGGKFSILACLRQLRSSGIRWSIYNKTIMDWDYMNHMFGIHKLIASSQSALRKELDVDVIEFALSACRIIFTEILKKAALHRKKDVIPAIIIIYSSNIVAIASSIKCVNDVTSCVNIANSLMINSVMTVVGHTRGLLTDSYIEAISTNAIHPYLTVFSKYYLEADKDAKRNMLESINTLLDPRGEAGICQGIKEKLFSLGQLLADGKCPEGIAPIQ